MSELQGWLLLFSCQIVSDSLQPYGLQWQASLSLTISHSLPKFMSIESVMPFNHLILCCPLLLLPSIYPGIRVFSNELCFASVGQNTGASASASVLRMSIQDWFPLRLTGSLSLQFWGLSSVFCSTTVQKNINSLVLCLLYGPVLTSVHGY